MGKTFFDTNDDFSYAAFICVRIIGQTKAAIINIRFAAVLADLITINIKLLSASVRAGHSMNSSTAANRQR